MLTNKKIWVLITVLSLLFVSCSVNNTEEDGNKDTIKVVTGEKSKALWGEALEKGSKNISISDWIDTKTPQKPNFIK